MANMDWILTEKLIGKAKTKELAEIASNDGRIAIPIRKKINHRIANLIGYGDFNKLVDRFGGHQLRLREQLLRDDAARKTRDRLIYMACKNRMDVNELSHYFGITTQRIYQIAASNDDQLTTPITEK